MPVKLHVPHPVSCMLHSSHNRYWHHRTPPAGLSSDSDFYQPALEAYQRPHSYRQCTPQVTILLLQADLVAILAASLPRGSAVEHTLVTECFLPFISMQGTLGNLHKARAREAVVGARSRGMRVVHRDGSREAVALAVNSRKLLQQLLEECCTPPLCCWCCIPVVD
jgi:hypothetical protein